MLHFQERNSGKVYKRKRNPRSWIRPGRTQVWWGNFVNDVVVSQEWKENFQMDKENFLKLCNELRSYIQKKSTNMRSSISVEKQEAITLYYLSDSYYSLSKMWRSTLHILLRENGFQVSHYNFRYDGY